MNEQFLLYSPIFTRLIIGMVGTIIIGLWLWKGGK